MLLDDALNGTAMRRPASCDDAKRNIQALKSVLGEVKVLRQSSHLSKADRTMLKQELKVVEDDVKCVLDDLKREKTRIGRGN
jgi:hypothetical protein